MEIMQYINEGTFAMVLCVYLVVRFENSIRSLEKSIIELTQLINLEKFNSEKRD